MQDVMVDLDRQREHEFGVLKQSKSYLEKNIVNCYNRYSLRIVKNQIYNFLYKSEVLNLASYCSIWDVMALDDYRATPNHFEVVILDAVTRSLTDHCLHFYLIPNGVNENGYVQYKSVNQSEYESARIKYKATHDKDLNGKESNYYEAIVECHKFLDDIKYNLTLCNNYKTFKQYIETFNSKNVYLRESNNSNLNRATAVSSYRIKDFIEGKMDPLIEQNITVTNCSEKNINAFKYYMYVVLNNIYVRESLKYVRKSLIHRLETDGIDAVVANVEVDDSLNLGSFRYVNQLIELGKDSYEDLVNRAFVEETIPEQLEKLLLQLLKLYYEFNHPSEKNHTYLSEFLIKNKISKSKFMSDLCDWSDSVQAMWPIFTSDQRKQFAERMPIDSTYRIRKTVYIRKSVYNTKQEGKWQRTDSTAQYGNALLEKMRGVMAIFNDENEHTRILDITEGENNSYIFEFITYKLEDTDVDGRRLGEFTAMFNRAFDETLYLSYTNE